METKHSTGPWEKTITPGDNYMIYDSNNQMVCMTTSEDRAKDEHIANASLIQAAPEMMEALQEVNVFLGHIEPNVGEEAFREICSIVGEAIRKASGISEEDEASDIDTEPKDEPLSKEWPDSSMVAKTEWNDYQLMVTFKNGKTYTYLDFPRERWTELLNCESIGKYINSQVKGQYSLK